jgi:radical SAM superfamily enzyme YgiQ (UPF0313 family)
LDDRTENMNLLFLQLPRLDHDVTSPGENNMLAAACLTAALERSETGKQWTVLPSLSEQETGSDQALITAILKAQPDVIAATCYLWNIERTLHLLACVRKMLPHVKIVLGGPEIADHHPLLKRSIADALCIGEGEPLFPEILNDFQKGPPATRIYRASEAKPIRLVDALPAPDHPINKPDAFGMAYLETNRGCPMKCAFCCYNLRRSATTCLEPDDVAERIRILRKRGAKEIRLVDPTFNAHPRFDEMLAMLRRVNRDKKIAFFVEIRADTLTDEQAKLMAQAGITEAEVGVQSTDPKVLRIIHRPLNEQKVWRGIEALLRHGIKPTVDFMYALPAQDAQDMQRSIDWLARFGETIHPQFLPTLLLPGTELRDRAKELGLRAQPLPPYRVLATDTLSSAQLARVEQTASEMLGGFDSPTPRFVGKRLAGLYNRPTAKFQVSSFKFHTRESISSNRVTRYFDFSYEEMPQIIETIKAAVNSEPHILWQFVLNVSEEFPLDIVDELVAMMRDLPGHWLDRLVSPLGQKKMVARRLLIKLAPQAMIDASWIDEAEYLLSEAFH